MNLTKTKQSKQNKRKRGTDHQKRKDLSKQNLKKRGTDHQNIKRIRF